MRDHNSDFYKPDYLRVGGRQHEVSRNNYTLLEWIRAYVWKITEP
jgi:hypothetical protein